MEDAGEDERQQGAAGGPHQRHDGGEVWDTEDNHTCHQHQQRAEDTLCKYEWVRCERWMWEERGG